MADVALHTHSMHLDAILCFMMWARCCGGVDALCTDTVCGAALDVLHSAPKYRKQKLIYNTKLFLPV